MQPWNHRGAESPRQEVRLSLIDLDLDRLLPFPLSRDYQKKLLRLYHSEHNSPPITLR